MTEMNGVKRSKFNFLEHGHVAYQINQNHECSNMVTHILITYPLYPPPDPGGGSIGLNLTFQNKVTLLIKSNRITKQTPLRTLGMGSVGQNSTFSEHGHVAYQI